MKVYVCFEVKVVDSCGDQFYNILKVCDSEDKAIEWVNGKVKGNTTSEWSWRDYEEFEVE